MSIALGSSIGNYQILSELGRGGMAIVYKAYQPSLRRYVALKVLPPQFTFDATFVQRFLQEARTAAGLNHPNIITIYDVGEANGTYYFAMQLIEGGSLQQLIRREGALSMARIVYMVQQLASALDYAHRKSLIHRDIKPANVMLGEQDHVTLMDFGIARAAEGSKLTQAGMVVGTPEYMSPEQAQGEEIDRRSDIYSLGVVVYEMFAGRVPFTGTTPHSVLHKHVYETPPPLRTITRGIPRDVEKVVAQALAKDPKKRYQSAGELAHALSRACGVKVLTPAPLSPVLTPVPPRARQAEGATLGMKAAGGTAGSTLGVADAETVGAERVAPSPKMPTPLPVPRKGPPLAYAGLSIVGLAALAALAVFLNSPKATPTPTAMAGPSLVVPTKAPPPTQIAAVTTVATPIPPRSTTLAEPTSPPTKQPAASPATASPVPPTTTSMATSSPTVKPSATRTPVLRPVLVSPANGASLTGDVISLQWHWPHALGENEHFDVRVWREGQPHNGIAWTEVTKYEVRGQAGGKWYWSIAVIRQTGNNPNGTKVWIPLTEESEVRWFEYSGSTSGPSPGEPTKPTPPGEPTKPTPPPDAPKLIPSPDGSKPSSG
jgi:serine/threonine protein kinase